MREFDAFGNLTETVTTKALGFSLFLWQWLLPLSNSTTSNHI
jgi:hypothetical protein